MRACVCFSPSKMCYVHHKISLFFNNEKKVSTKQEQSTMVAVKDLSKEITEAEAKLNLLSTELEKCQGVVVSARTTRLLSTYDLAKVHTHI
jgi:hypothetical protein